MVCPLKQDRTKQNTSSYTVVVAPRGGGGRGSHFSFTDGSWRRKSLEVPVDAADLLCLGHYRSAEEQGCVHRRLFRVGESSGRWNRHWRFQGFSSGNMELDGNRTEKFYSQRGPDQNDGLKTPVKLS